MRLQTSYTETYWMHPGSIWSIGSSGEEKIYREEYRSMQDGQISTMQFLENSIFLDGSLLFLEKKSRGQKSLEIAKWIRQRERDTVISQCIYVLWKQLTSVNRKKNPEEKSSGFSTVRDVKHTKAQDVSQNINSVYQIYQGAIS